MAGAILGAIPQSLFVARAVFFGDVGVSLFLARAAFRDIWNDSQSLIWTDSQSARCCIFQCKMLVLKAKHLGCEAGSGRTLSVLDPGRIVPALYTFRRFRVFENFSDFLETGFSWQAQYLVLLAGNSCCSAHSKCVSYVTGTTQ